MPDRIYLNVPYAEKDAAKSAGAKWDVNDRGWWINSKTDLVRFRKWLPRIYRNDVPLPHLVSELVPESTWYVNLRSILSTEQWDALRKDCYEKAGWRCQVCGQQGDRWPVECNEQWQYLPDPEPATTGTQKLLRLAALCPTCHSVKHLGKAQIDGRFDEALKQLQFVNGWSECEAEEHAAQAFETWEQRSAIEWRFDLSLLRDLGIEKITLYSSEQGRLPAIAGIEVEIVLRLTPVFNWCSYIEPTFVIGMNVG